MTAGAGIEGRLQAAIQSYLQAPSEIEFARENAFDAVVEAQQAGWTQAAYLQSVIASSVDVKVLATAP